MALEIWVQKWGNQTYSLHLRREDIVPYTASKGPLMYPEGEPYLALLDDELTLARLANLPHGLAWDGLQAPFPA